MKISLVLLTIFVLLASPAIGKDGITFKTENITVVEVADNVTSLTGAQQALIVETCTHGRVKPVEWVTQTFYWSMLKGCGINLKEPVNKTELMPVWDEKDLQTIWDIRVLIPVGKRIARVPAVMCSDMPSITSKLLSKTNDSYLYAAVILKDGHHKVASFDPIGIQEITILPELSG